jgi:hypothetical protein
MLEHFGCRTNAKKFVLMTHDPQLALAKMKRLKLVIELSAATPNMTMWDAIKRLTPADLPTGEKEMAFLQKTKVGTCLQQLDNFKRKQITVVGNTLNYHPSSVYRPILERQYQRGERIVELDIKLKRKQSTINTILLDGRRLVQLNQFESPVVPNFEHIIPAVNDAPARKLLQFTPETPQLVIERSIQTQSQLKAST